ncbi:MAG: hypothetical protein JW384_02156 [Nitrosomonadaceae bacterium]|nr:hypothetical protein [Nitrosomonadaceae bacterium]
MGRPKKWNPSPFTARERITGHMLRCKYGPNMQTELRVKKDFGDLCRMNHCTPEDAYVPFIGQMRVAGMSAGTIREYVGHVVKGKRSTAAYIALRTAESLQTDSPVVHAADTDQEHIESLIAKTKGLTRAHLWLMMVTGARSKDVSRLRARCFKKRSKKSMVILFCWTKGIKRLRHRREVEYPLEGLMAPPCEFGSLLRKSKPDDTPFACTTAISNAALREAGGRGERTTTGTFRRLFSKRIDKHCKENNIPKRSMMLHASDDMDAAFYAIDNRN